MIKVQIIVDKLMEKIRLIYHHATKFKRIPQGNYFQSL